MSLRKQIREVNRTRSRMASWLDRHPDGPTHFDEALHYAVDDIARGLNTSTDLVGEVLSQPPLSQCATAYLYEESMLRVWRNSSIRPLDDFIAKQARRERPLGRRFVTALAKSTMRVWKITEVDYNASVSALPLREQPNEDEKVRKVFDFMASQQLSPGDFVLTRVIPMPEGRIFSASLLPLSKAQANSLVRTPPEKLIHTGFVSWGVLTLSEIPGVSVPDVTFVSEGNSDLDTNILSSNDNDSIGSHSSTAERSTPDQYTASTEQNTVQPEPTVTGDSAQSSSDESEHTDHQKNGHTDQPLDQTQAPNREKLLDRIRRLFAMAQETEASPHEAEIALRRCQSLMSRYGISEADLLTSQFSTEAFRAGNRVPMFVRWLASAVQNLHSVLFVSGGSEPPEFRGFDIDVKVAMMTMDYLENAVERALANRRRSGTFPPGRSAGYDYRVSFAMEVNCRVQSLVDERKAAEAAAAVTGISLTVRKMEIVDAECGQGLVSGASYRGARPGEAAEAGRTDGSKVSLDPQVDTDKDTRGRNALFSGVSY